jgi:hypothetical protein
MCGPSSQEKDITASQQEMYDTLSQGYKTTFGQQQAITGALTQMFTPILQAGPSQTGMSPSEENALRTQATEGTATDYAAAQRATAQALAARGGGNSMLPDSTAAQVLAGNANAMARQQSQQQLGITAQNYAQGYQNWQAATNALSNTASLINPLGYAGSSTQAGQVAGQSAQTMASQSNSIWNAAIGALGGIGGAALGNPSGIMSMFSKGGAATPGFNWATNYANPLNQVATINTPASGTALIPSQPLSGTMPSAGI